MKENKYRLVNWEEGMDVNYNHFQQLENYFIERLCDNQASRINKNNYGLLPAPDGKGDSSEFEISERVTGKVEIKLRRCNALTAGGYRISYHPEQDDFILYTHSFDTEKEQDVAKTHYWDVILSVDPYKRLSTGIPNEEETPPRHPDATEQYRLSIAPEGKTHHNQLGFYHLVIGRVRQKGGRFEVDTNYIPPCTGMRSHSDLVKYYEAFGTYLNDIERASKIIISKVKNRTQNSPLAHHIGSVCEEMTRYIASIYFIYRNSGREMAPVEIVNYFSTLAHTCYISLNFISKIEKEELLKYFYEWSDVTPGTFEEMLSNTLGIIYDHTAIRTVMIQIESYLRVMSELWLKLSTLEYIGQHKDNIVVSERAHQPEIVKPKGGWTILD
ncbi:MAG: hypothetical protein LBU57_10305 [Dysgonamonadaceae bacterium]|jgi:hypothetical protein|nr:hypothetical protein [Dysgonamonadaceae bacterium]